MKTEYKKILRGSIAIFFVTIANSISSIVDAAFAGQFLGEKALAASGMCNSVYSFCAVISGLCTYGIGVAIFKLIGSGKGEKGNQYFTSVFVFSGIFTAAIMIFMLVFSNEISYVIAGGTTDKELLQLVKDFFIGLSPGILPLVLFSVIMPVAELNNKNKAITISLILSVITNAAIDYLSIVFNFGLLGIGLSTSLANLVILIVLLTTVAGSGKNVKLSFHKLKIMYLIEVIINGLPYALRRIANVVNRLMYNYFIVATGSTALLAGFSGMCASRQFFLAFGIGLGSSTSLIISYYVGLGDKKSSDFYLKSIIRLAHIGCAIIGIGVILLSPLFAMIYSPIGSDAFYYDVIWTCVLGISIPFSALIEIYLGYLLAINKKLATNVFMVIHRALLQIPLLLIMSTLFGDWGIIATIFLPECITVVIIKIYNYNINKKGYVDRLFEIDKNLYFKVTNHSEIIPALDKAESFLTTCNLGKNVVLKVRLCLEEIIRYTVSTGFKDRENNYIEAAILVSSDSLVLNINDNCNDYKLLNNINNIMAENEANLIGIKLIIEMCDSVKQMEFLGENNIQIKIKN